MPFEIVRNDITNMRVDAIVNTANPKPVVGSGTDTMIHKKAGPELLVARQKIGSIDVGSATITPAFDLQAKYVIHTVGPVYRGGLHGEPEKLAACYRNSLALSAENGCKSIAFPCISTGIYGYPKEDAAKIAVREVRAFLAASTSALCATADKESAEMEVIFCCFSEKDKAVYEKILNGKE